MQLNNFKKFNWIHESIWFYEKDIFKPVCISQKSIFKKFPLNPRMKFCDDCSIHVLSLVYFKFCHFLHNLQFCASIHKFCNLLHNLWSCADILYILQFRCRIFKILQNCLPRGAILQYSPYWKLSARCRIHGSPKYGSTYFGFWVTKFTVGMSMRNSVSFFSSKIWNSARWFDSADGLARPSTTL